MSRRGRPRLIYHRGRGRRRWGLFTWLQVIGMCAVLLFIVGYIVRLWFFAPVSAASWSLWLPLVGR